MVSESGTIAASYNVSLSPPAAFPFKTLDVWPKWCRRFEQYQVASGLSKESQERQISTLLYCLGEEAEDSGLDEYLRRAQKRLQPKFDAFFGIRKNG